MVRFAIVVGVFLGAWTESHAVDLACSEFRPMLQDRQLERPEKPYCASSYSPFLDSYDFDKCRREVEDYQAQVQKYLTCLQSESNEAIDEYKQVVASFNRRAQQ